MAHQLKAAGRILLLVLACLATATAAEYRRIGRFQPRPACTLYLVNNGNAATVRLSLHQGPRAEGDRVMIRLFDPDEQLAFRQYVEPGRMRDMLHPGAGEIHGIPIKIPVVSEPGDLLLQMALPLTRPGIWQLRLVAGARNSVVSVDLPPQVEYGVSFQNGEFTSWDPALANVHLYVPPHAEKLTIAGGPLQVRDHTRDLVLETAETTAEEASLPVHRTECLWTLGFPQPDTWRLRAWGMPVILCPDAETAETLRGSVEVCADGTVVAHKFQVHMHDMLPEILAPGRVGRTEDLVADLAASREDLLADPQRNAILMQSFDGLLISINPLLRRQNLDPENHWAGVLDGWQEYAEKTPPENRWDRLTEVPGLWGGASTVKTCAGAEKLALAALTEVPGNPWQGRRELLWRAVAACFKDLMTLAEAEVFYGAAEQLPYPGFMAFVVAQKTFPAYELVAPEMPDDVRDLWTRALQHIVDRSYPDGLVSARNQSSHYLVAYNAFANGSGQATAADLAAAYVQRWVRGQSPAGYHVEQQGSDASYIGMTNWHMAVAYRQRPDPDLLESIRRAYVLFNHTVAPEPDGTMLGACNMNHRVGDSFVNEQWGGARSIVDDLLPEVAAWTVQERQQAGEGEAVRTIETAIARGADYLHPNYGPGVHAITFPRWQWWAPDPVAAPWPATEPAPFIRTFGEDFIAIRRPAYYTVVFVGSPAPVPHYVAYRELYRRPFPEGDDCSGGPIELRRAVPFNGGGLSLLWAPDYGSSLLATCWTPTAHHGLLAHREDGTRWWEEYFAVDHDLDAEAATLTVNGTLEKLPLDYIRTYTFAATHVDVTVRIEATDALELTSLAEVIPYARGTAKARSPVLSAGDATIGAVKTDHLTLRDNTGAGLDISFAAPREVILQPNGRQRRDLQVGRAEIALPATWTTGQTSTLHYRLQPVPAP